ncbi:MAG: hypothetical protein ACM3PX_06215 [Omnitrophica WOR_2 bacterium]|jgi:hypothetical protein
MKKAIHWLPRILTILAICFVSIFALDAFNKQLTILQQLEAFFVHMIPSFVLLVLLGVAWQHKLTGGIIFTVLGIAFGIFLYIWNLRINHNVFMTIGIVATLALPFIVAGILFLLDYRNMHKGELFEPDTN